jgi:hypothetical protein
MLDIQHIPGAKSDTQIFYSQGSIQTWQKPRGAKFIHIFAIGGGGGGGGGGVVTSTGTRAGGGGGGSAGFCRGFYPAFLLPDILYVQVGAGGAGGASQTGGSAGTTSFVSLTPAQTPTLAPIILSGNTNCGSGGGAGGVSTSTAGAAGLVATVPGNAIVGGVLGLNILAVSGFIGKPGSLSNGAGSPAFTGSNLAQGGASGGFRNGSTSTFGTGGTNTSGSVILLSNVNGGLESGSGDSGYASLVPFCSMGGGGGGGTLGATGGRGGDGGYGSGGGGGGSATTTGGRGGKGGDGLVIITTIF